MSRKDNKGRVLRTGESQRKCDGRYVYRYTNKRTGKRESVYSMDLAELREMERKIQRDIDDGISTAISVKKLDVNALFEHYLSIREIDDSTKSNYIGIWNYHIRDELGKMRVIDVKPSHIKATYAKLSREDYSRNTIKIINAMLFPMFEIAVEDDIIRKNPAKNAIRDYGREAKIKEALTLEEQENLFEFVKNSNIYSVYLPLLQIMVGTALRAGELVGLTWNDVDLYKQEITINHQLIYKNYGDGCRFHMKKPKTKAGERVIPMSQAVRRAFIKQKEYQFMLGIDHSVKVEELNDFVFTTKNGTPIMPNALNNILYNIVDAYNKEETYNSKKEKRKAVLLNSVSAHTMRHTGCTRMAEAGMDPKVLQYIMGHANIQVTMSVYNHITGKERIEREIKKIDEMKIG